MPDRYDVAVIGAGIAGVSAAWHLHRKGLRVVLIDRSSVPASGGSGAAGAFVAPKIGKGGALQQLTNEAFAYAQAFYREQTPEHFTDGGVVRIPRDAADAQRFPLYTPHNYPVYELWSADDLARRGIHDPHGGFFFPEAGDCDAPAVCRMLVEGIDFVQGEVERVERSGFGAQVSGWQIHFKHPPTIHHPPSTIDHPASNIHHPPSTIDHPASNIHHPPSTIDHPTSNIQHPTFTIPKIVLATGYQNDLFDMRYMGIKGLWGSRGDYLTASELPVSLHKTLSVSSTREGIVKIGATHVKHPEPCRICDGQPLAGLFAGASELVDTSDFRLKEILCGMRSGSRDFFPVAGEVIDVPYLLEHHPAITRGAKPELHYLEGVYVLNGLGGRGFVFAPLMGRWLAERIASGTPIDRRVHPDRLFWKWVRTFF